MTAVVASSVDYGEADRIVTLLTREHGRLSARARGARRSQRRYAGCLDRCSLIAARLSGPPARLSFLDAELIEPFLGLRDRLEASAMAAYVTELAALVTPEGEAQPRVFGLLVEALSHLADPATAVTPAFARACELKLLDAAGLMPRLAACAACGRPLPGGSGGAGRLALSAQAGGALCAADAASDPAAAPLDASDLRHLAHLARAPLGEPDPDRAVGAPPGGDARQAAALRAFVEAHLGRRPRSGAFLEQVVGP